MRKINNSLSGIMTFLNIKKHFSRIEFFCLFIFILFLTPQIVRAQSGGTTIDMSDNAITGGTTGDGWTYTVASTYNRFYMIHNGANVTVTGTGDGFRHIEVEADAKATVTLNNVSMTMTYQSNVHTPIRILDRSILTLNIAEGSTNVLIGNDNSPGLEVSAYFNAELIINGLGDGSGILYATGGTQDTHYSGGPGIGGYDCGKITINGGIIEATGGERSAGIGGGGSWNTSIGGNGGVVTINGGNVKAIAGLSGCGIGGGVGSNYNYGLGGSININGSNTIVEIFGSSNTAQSSGTATNTGIIVTPTAPATNFLFWWNSTNVHPGNSGTNNTAYTFDYNNNRRYIKVQIPGVSTYGVSLNPSTNKDFGSVEYGYNTQSAHSVTVNNTGNQATGALTIALSGTDASSFSLSKTSITNITYGGNDNFTVVPNIGLSAGSYSATVTVTGNNGIIASFNVSFTVNPHADLAITKTVSNASPTVGSNVTYTLILTNNGPDDATGVEVTDVLPAVITFVSASPSEGTYTPSTGVWNIGNISAGSNKTLEITTTVTSVGSITNTASCSGDLFDIDLSNNTSSVSLIAIKSNTSIALISNTTQSTFGQTVTFTATVSGGYSPTGTVQFKNGTTDIGSPITLSAGIAELTISTLTAGSNSITAVYNGDTNNNASSSAAITQVVSKADQTGFDFTVASTVNKIYGDASFTATAEGGQSLGSTTYVVTINPDVISVNSTSGEVSILKVGSAVITATKAGDSNYNSITATITVNVSSKSITVTAIGGGSYYGDNPANPGLSADGLVAGETVAVLTGLSNSFDINSATEVGNYTLEVIGMLNNTNYTITDYYSGQWTVNPAIITVTANSGSSNFGESPTNPGISFSGLPQNFDESLLAGLYNNFSITSDTPAGSYTLYVEGNFEDSNFNLSRNSGVWVVNQLPGYFENLPVFRVVYSPTLTLADVILPEGYKWNSPGILLKPGNNQIFAVTYIDQSGNYTSVSGTLQVNVRKAEGAAVSGPPTLNGLATESSIAVHILTLPDNPGKQTVEYAISTNGALLDAPTLASLSELSWQSGTTFTGVFSDNTTYYIYARSASNTYYSSGPAQVSAAIKVGDFTGIVETGRAPSLLTAYINDGVLYVSGLTPGKPWRIYNILGTLIYQGIATDVVETGRAPSLRIGRGIYIILSEGEVVKIRN